MKKNIVSLILAVAPAVYATAQHTYPVTQSDILYEQAQRMVDDGHYTAAQTNLHNYVKNSGKDINYLDEAEGLNLICDYYLRTKHTEEKINKYLNRHSDNQFTERLKVMQANLMAINGDYNGAMEAYKRSDIGNLPESEQADACLYKAITYINLGNTSEAKPLLNAIKDSKKYAEDVTYYTAYTDYSDGNYNEAIKGFSKVASTKAYRRKTPVYISDCLLLTGKANEAYNHISEYNKAYTKTELSDEATRIEGEALYGQGRYEEAAEKLDDYCKNTDDPKRTALYKLAMSSYKNGEYQKAADNFILSAATSNDALSQNAFMHAGICYLKTGNKNQARMAFEQASSSSLNKTIQEEALYNYALCLHEGSTAGFGEQVTAMERYLNLFPKSQHASKVSMYLTEVYFTTKNYDAALASINKIKQPTSEILSAKQNVLYNLGSQAFNNGKFDKANELLSQAINIGSYNNQSLTDAYYWRGETNYRLANYPKATSDFMGYLSQAPSSDSNYKTALYNTAYSLFKQKRYKEALGFFQQFTGSDNTNKTLTADAYNRIGDCLLSSKNYSTAAEAYQKAIATDNSVGDYSLYQEAIIRGVNGNYSGKVELLDQMQKQYTGSQYTAEAMLEQARAYTLNNEKEKAIQTLQRLISQQPLSNESKRGSIDLALLLNETGKTGEAVEIYKRLIENNPNSEEAQTALSNLKDIFTRTGNVDEYAVIAAKAGKAMSDNEIDDMFYSAANNELASGNYSNALKHFTQLSNRTVNDDLRHEALEGILQTSYQTKQYEQTIDAANKLLADSRTSQDMNVNALFLRAAAFNATGKTKEAIDDWTILSQMPQTAYGAQSAVLLAEYAYNSEQYDSAEKILLKFIDSGTPHSYWLARGFITLSDVYNKTGREVEAKQYLLSLKSNYSENEEINSMVEKRLK